MPTLSEESERDGQSKELDIAKLVDKVRESDCSDSFGQLRCCLDYYIRLFSRKYKIAGHDVDEIEQECLVALRYKAIEDFNPSRGKFKSFAVLCIKRHLFSLIKGNHQQKRRVLNQSLSLDEDRSDDGESLSLANLIAEDALTADDQLAKDEVDLIRRKKLKDRLSPLEKEVFDLYTQRYHYDEIVIELIKIFPDKKMSKKTVDNALQRLRNKAHEMSKNIDWEE